MVSTQQNYQKTQLPLLCWRIPTTKFHILRMKPTVALLQILLSILLTPTSQKRQLSRKGKWSKHNQYIYFTKNKGERLFQNIIEYLWISHFIPWDTSAILEYRLPNSLRVPIISLQQKSILGTFPYGSLPLSNPCGKSFCYRRSKQHLYPPILENVQLI